MSSEKPIRVLSLFDGMGTGLYVLKKLGFNIEVYYASEIDPEALLLTKFHYGDEIKHIGSVTDIDIEKLKQIGPINLLIGGSPCSDLTNLNYRKKGIYDPNGTGILFFDYYRILEHLKLINKQENREFFWMFENVKNMENITKDIISNFLGCRPNMIDSVNVSPMCRQRYFWSNIPEMDHLQESIKENVGPLLEEYLDINLGRKANYKKIRTITTKKSCLQDGSTSDPVSENGVATDLYITEIEKIFGFPPHYTDVGDFNFQTRLGLLGRGWSVQVAEAIFQLLNKYFK